MVYSQNRSGRRKAHTMPASEPVNSAKVKKCCVYATETVCCRKPGNSASSSPIQRTCQVLCGHTPCSAAHSASTPTQRWTSANTCHTSGDMPSTGTLITYVHADSGRM